MNFIPSIAKLARPYLLLFFRDYGACFVENTLTRSTELCIASRKLAPILQAVEGNLEDVGIELHLNSLTLFLLLFGHARAQVAAYRATFILIAQVQITIELI